LRKDDEAIRTQSTIIGKTVLAFSETASALRMVCIRNADVVGARSAQGFGCHAQPFAKPARTKNPSVRIAACARKMKPFVRNRRSLCKPFSSF
jgi:hypothetical protein